MSSSRTAVISDIHGNRWALEAVLADIAARGVDEIVNLGDSLWGPLDPAGTARILLERGILSVRGNEDRLLLEAPDDAGVRAERDRMLGLLERGHVDWLRSLAPTAGTDAGLFLCHGTPDRDDVYLLRAVGEGGVVPRGPQELIVLLESVASPVVCCGHDHVPASVCLPDERLVVDPGSVGLPAFFDSVPFPHVMETGSPEARYAVVTREAGGISSEDIAVSYDWRAAAATAEENGRSDWAAWLRTGRAAIGDS